MIDKINDIWILHKDGLVIFKRTKDEKVDPQLFGGFISAVNTFTKQLDETGMSGFELGQNRFIIRRENPLIFIGNSDITIKPKVIEKEMDSLIAEFLKLYPKQIFDDWNGDVTQFDKFEKELNKDQKVTLYKFKEALW